MKFLLVITFLLLANISSYAENANSGFCPGKWVDYGGAHDNWNDCKQAVYHGSKGSAEMNACQYAAAQGCAATPDECIEFADVALFSPAYSFVANVKCNGSVLTSWKCVPCVVPPAPPEATKEIPHMDKKR